MTNTGLTRKEKEKLVVELYKQEKTYAQIAKEAHISLRDIRPILNRAGEHQP
jgi:DNA invertase Pin-like site-specific DNA recombinase